MTVTNELIDSLLSNYKKSEDLIGENGLLKQLTKKLVERALEAEMAHHLGHAKNESVCNPTGNTRNGKSKKTFKGDLVNCPLTSHGTATPALSPKSSPSTKPAGHALMTRFCRSTPVA